jgi:hypothetical protein
VVDDVFILGKDLLQLLEKDPEAVVLVGEAAKKYIENTRAREQAASVVVQQCDIRGELSDEFARIRFEITVRSDRDGRSPVPIALGEATLLSVSIDGGPPFLTRDRQGWIAWVEGRGRHSIIVEAQLSLGTSANLPSLSCGIPEAPITSLQLGVQRALSEIRLTPSAPVTVRAVESGRNIEAALGPRNRLDLRWRWGAPESDEPRALLRCSSQVISEVASEGIQIKTELWIQSLRGGQQTIELRNSAEERVLDVQTTDGKVVGWQSAIDGAEQRILLHYSEPLTGTSELVITSERPWTQDRATLRGWVVQGAYSHRGRIAVRSAPELDVAVTETKNAQATDTLPATLRSPRNEAAFASYVQPYHLTLSIQPRRPHTTVQSNVVVSYGESSSTVMGQWRFTVHGGKVTQVDFHLPQPFTAEQFVFSDAVQAVRSSDTPEGRIAQVYLKGTPAEFELRLRAAISLVVARNLVKLELPAPRNAQSESSRLFLVGSPDIDLEPTPNFVALYDAADESIVKELVGQSAPFRAFECRTLLDQVAFRLTKSAGVLWHQSHAQLRFGDDSVLVRQSFDFMTQGVATRNLRFAVPQPIRGSVKVESAPGQVIAESPADELVVRLTGEPVDPPRVRLSYRLPLPGGLVRPDAESSAVPLVQATNSRCVATEVAVSAPENVYLLGADGDWQIVATNPVRDARGDATRWTLRSARPQETAALRWGSSVWLPQPVTVVQRMWIEAAVNSQSDWRMRARLVITDPSGSRLRLRIPAGSRLTAVRWDGRGTPVQRGSETDIVELPSAVPGQSPAMLDMEFAGVVSQQRGSGNRLAWEAPQLLGEVVWGRVFWQIEMPSDTAVLRGPAGYCDENALVWSGSSLRLAPRHDDTSLESWLTGTDTPRRSVASAQRLLYSRLLSAGPLHLTVIARPVLILICSGLVMVFGLLLVALPGRLRLFLALAALLVSTLLAASEPQAAIECARSAGWGLLIAAAAGACHILLMRRRTSRQSVFPEPAHLAKARSSANRGGSDFALMHYDAPNATNGAAEVPRLAASSPSNR